MVHVDESLALDLTGQQAAGTAASFDAVGRRYVTGDAGHDATILFHRIPLHNVFAASAEGGKDGDEEAQNVERLRQLLRCVDDETGREDLRRYLRMHVLLGAAQRLGCTRVARGDCMTTLAIHVVAATAKGRGYSVPGDVSQLDARWASGGWVGGWAGGRLAWHKAVIGSCHNGKYSQAI